MNARILASLVRITDPMTASRLASYILFHVAPMEGSAIAGQIPGAGPGIAVNQDWLDGASDEQLDGILAHELAHAAYGPKGEPVMAALGNFAFMRVRFVPREAREAFNAAMDAIVDAAIARDGGKPPLMARMPDGFAKEIPGS